MKLITTIMPVYNREKYLAAAIESVLNQTYDNIEMIIVDDGSNDLSLSIAESYKKKYTDKIKILKQKNQGPSCARNNAIKIAKGDLIAFIDSDDLWSSDKIELQVNLINQYSNLSFVYSGYYVINERGEITQECLPDVNLSGLIHEKLWTIDNNISGGTILVPKNILIAAGCFDESLKGAENLDLRIRLSRLGEVYFVDKCLYYYRKHDSNLTSNHIAMNDVQLKLINKHFDNYAMNNSSLFNIVMSKYYYNIGVQMFGRMDLKNAMNYFYMSIRKNPMNYNCFVRLFRCFLGVRINNLLSKAKS
jgi:glycosyltransferase involved in cell wall biosynthesis